MNTMPSEAQSRRQTGSESARPRFKGPFIIIGIDFGTTYSGVAWATSSKPEQINVITNWPSHHVNNTDKEKSPTAICYNVNNDAPQWGFTVPSTGLSMRWFKFCLLDEDDLPAHTRDCDQITVAKAMLTQLNKHVTEVIADYLRELWDHTLDNIERDVGGSLLEISKLKVVFSIPAIWPAYAQARMRKAIERAGILDLRAAGDTILTFVSEPEAAALATIGDMSGRALLQPQDHFVVCDAGGGTVDIITYSVVKTDPLTIRESIKGDGKLCGAVFLDDSFRRLLRKLLPRPVWVSLGSEGIDRIVNDEWENGIKPQFLNDGQKWDVQIPFRGTLQDRSHSPEVKVNSEDILGIFQPVVLEVTELVVSQVQGIKAKYKKMPKFVILVGGFGRSRYLHQRIKASLKKKVEILQSSGARPWTAVCRGAVIKGLTEENFGNSIGFAIDSRVSRASYGTVFNFISWDAAMHDAKDKEWCPVNREFIAKDQTRWFLRMGEHIKEDKPIVHSFWQNMAKADEEIVTEMIYSTAINPSTRFDATVKTLCIIRWSKIPQFDELPQWTNAKGEKFRTVNYDIKMVANGVSLDFEISHDGAVVASKNVAVEFDNIDAAFRRSPDSDDDGSDEDYRDDGKLGNASDGSDENEQGSQSYKPFSKPSSKSSSSKPSSKPSRRSSSKSSRKASSKSSRKASSKSSRKASSKPSITPSCKPIYGAYGDDDKDDEEE